MELWQDWGWLFVAVQLCGVEYIDLCSKCPFILAILRPEWPITWLNSSPRFLFNFFKQPLSLLGITYYPLWSLPDTSTGLKTI